MAAPRSAAVGPPAEPSRRRLVEIRTSDGSPVCEQCLVADTPSLRLRGLLGRGTLPKGEGVWIRPATSIHMFFMRFAIDAIFLDRDNTVVKIHAGLRPWRISACRRSRSVLELANGEAESRGVRVGDRLEAVEPSALALAA